MATLVFTAVGTLIGGPLGGALGALAGQQLDRALVGGGHRDGARLKELAITTSSYGAAIPRPYGRLRMPGSMIWATDLAESSESSGGGKGGGSTTTYSYSASFAVALASRPLGGIGRIWADGTLLRGAAGDLKVGGAMRFYDGHGDQAPDPLIASAQGAGTPAFRHTAYVVFEGLQLTEFGNRIPALTFELLADDGEVTLAQLLEPLDEAIEIARQLPALAGFAYEGGSLADLLAAIDPVYPLAAEASGEALRLLPADAVPETVPLLPEPVAADHGESFGAASGTRRQRATGTGEVPSVLRYYDLDRDYQAGLQRADGRARPGRERAIEFPGTLAAADARTLINQAAERAGWSRDTIAWRIAELDSTLGPGSIVRLPELAGNWRVEGWEWREHGVELELRRLPRGPARQPAADPGLVASVPDRVAPPTVLQAFELPWDGIGSGAAPKIYAAPSAATAGWTGAALYADRAGALVPLVASGSRRNVIGVLAMPAAPSAAQLIDRQGTIEVELLADDFALTGTTVESLAQGANRALVGGEVFQFLEAEALGGGRWRLTGLLRGRGGTETAAQAGHPAGASFVLLDGSATLLDADLVGPPQGATIVALGLGDAAPVSVPLANPGLTLRPLTPVHPRARLAADGALELAWIRRARGAWDWPDEVEAPLGEENEAYLVGVGPVDAPPLRWDLATAALTLAPATVAMLAAEHVGEPLWVRQVGSFALSPPLLLTTIA